MTWSGIVGSSIFWIALFASITLYIIKRKWYPIMYLTSLALYIYTVVFVIDVFALSNNGVLLVLAASTLVMIGAGLYLSRRYAVRA